MHSRRKGVASLGMAAQATIADHPNRIRDSLAREVNAQILGLEARVREMGLRERTPGQDGIGLFCECGCMAIVVSAEAEYKSRGGAWLDGHEPKATR